MWFITGINLATKPKATRCFGYFTTFNRAVEAIKENRGNMEECLYDYLVLEEFGEGIFNCSEKEVWFRWDDSLRKWNGVYKPEELENIVSFGIG